MKPVPVRHLRDRCARLKGFGNDAPLLLVGEAPPALRPGQDLGIEVIHRSSNRSYNQHQDWLLGFDETRISTQLATTR